VIDVNGFSGEVVAVKRGNYASPTSTEEEAPDMELLVLCGSGDPSAVCDKPPLDAVFDHVAQMGAPEDGKNEEEEKKDFVENADKKSTLVKGEWRLRDRTKGEIVSHSRLKMQGYSQKEWDLEWEVHSLGARMRQQRASTNPKQANPVLCRCGKELEEVVASQLYNGAPIACNYCGNVIPDHKVVFHCRVQYSIQHLQGFDLCLNCSEARRITQHIGHPKCECGKELVSLFSSDAYGNDSVVACNECGCAIESDKALFHCPKNKNKPHMQGYDLCLSCGKKEAQKSAKKGWFG